MTPLPRTLALLLAAAASIAGSQVAPGAHAAEPVTEAAPTTPHEVGWVCLLVSDTRIQQVSAFNKDAPVFSVWVDRDRFHVEEGTDGAGGRVCVPTIVRLGEQDLPENTLIFERPQTLPDGGTRKSVAEVVLTPSDPTLAEATIKLVGVPSQWSQVGGTWTFSSLVPVRFAARTVRGLLGEGEGPPPSTVFSSAGLIAKFSEPCTPVELLRNTVGFLGRYDAADEKVHARGTEPFKIEAGTVLSRCDGLAADGTTIAISRRLAEDEDGWFLVPRESELRPYEGETVKYTAQEPLGGYHVCRQPTWRSALLEPVPLAGAWELFPNAEWRATPETDASDPLPTGTPVTLLDHRDTWALTRILLDGVPRTFALPANVVAMPSGPGSEARSLAGGLCPWPKGEWRAAASATDAFRVSQQSPGAELAGLWLEIPDGTQLLALCQEHDGKCEPIYVGGSQSDPTNRLRLVRYAGQLLAVRERDLRERVAGIFEAKRERPRYWRAEDAVAEVVHNWALDIGPGGRLSFVDKDHFAWAARLRAQNLDDGLGFEGSFGAGGDGVGTFLEVTGGVGTLLTRFANDRLELRLAGLAKLDIRVTGSGGMGVDVIGKLQLRWVNDFTPISFEAGVNIGFGGAFGDGGDSGVTFGMPLWITVQLIQF